jgi:hypothetical protein
MPSDELKLITICAYLTDTSNEWRQLDYTASKMVKAIKSEPINGYFEYPIAGRIRRFNQSNVVQFTERVPKALARAIARYLDRPATLIPIPNAHVTSPNSPDFRTLEIAEGIARESDGLLTAVPALVFTEPQIRSRDGGPRSPYHFENVYRVVQSVWGPVVLFDDVCTSGGHLVGALWKLVVGRDCKVWFSHTPRAMRKSCNLCEVGAAAGLPSPSVLG